MSPELRTPYVVSIKSDRGADSENTNIEKYRVTGTRLNIAYMRSFPRLIMVTCPVFRCADPGDSTVNIQFNGEHREGRFRFQMFKWRWSAEDVYLHCEIDICNKTLERCAGYGVGFGRRMSEIYKILTLFDACIFSLTGRVQRPWQFPKKESGRLAEGGRLYSGSGGPS